MSKCSENKLVIYKNGTPFSRPREDSGCIGESHTYTTTTTLVEPVTYEWRLDNIHNPIIGRQSSFTYTFDNKTHNLILVAKNAECGIQIDLKVIGKTCPVCPVKCRTESVFIPKGILECLFDDAGKAYYFQGIHTVECGTSGIANIAAAKEIYDMIKSAAGCQTESLKVTFQYNYSSPLCLMLTIRNSPIKFKYLKIGNTKYGFSTNGC